MIQGLICYIFQHGHYVKQNIADQILYDINVLGNSFLMKTSCGLKFFDSMYMILMPKLTFSSNLFQVFYQCWTWSKSSFEKVFDVKLYKSIESIFARKIIIINFVSVQHVTCIEIAKVKLCFNGIKIIILNNNRNTKTQHNFQ